MQSTEIYTVGIDEAGRGAWAGPLVAAAVLLPERLRIPKGIRLDDSKLLSASQRTESALYIRSIARIGIGIVSNARIDTIGIQRANKLAFHQALMNVRKELRIEQGSGELFVIIDGRKICSFKEKHSFVVDGDALHREIAAASIIAKTTRDTIMRRLHTLDSRYLFDKHKGYGTAAHQQALALHGVSAYHRMSYAPIAAIDNLAHQP